MSDSRRAKRIAGLIRSEISRALVEDIADPALHELNVHDVDLSADLKNATIFYSVSNGLPAKEVEKGIGRAIPYFRKRLGENLGLRYVPQLKFEKDQHADEVFRVFSLLDEVREGGSPT